MPTIVHKYNLLPPVEGVKEIEAQLHAGHAYQKKLVEIERKRREEMRAYEESVGPIAQSALNVREAAEKLDAQLHEAHADKLRQKLKGFSPEWKKKLSETRKEVQQAKKAWRELRFTLKTADAPPASALKVWAARTRYEKEEAGTKERKEAHKAWREAQEVLRNDPLGGRYAIDMRADCARREARAETDALWGTYLLIEGADDASRKTPLYDGLEPRNPQFPAYMSMRVGAQLQSGPELEELSTDNFARIVHTPTGIDLTGRKNLPAGKHRAQYQFWLRVGGEGTRPVWGKWPLILHRPIPARARIKVAVVHRRVIDLPTQPRWDLTLTLDAEHYTEDPTVKLGSGTVAFCLCWEEQGEEVIAGRWLSSTGLHGEVRVKQDVLGSFAKVRELQSTRDFNLNAIRQEFYLWLVASSHVPDWMRAMTEGLFPDGPKTKWRSTQPLREITRTWNQKDEPKEADAKFMRTELEKWRYHDEHLWRWSRRQYIKTLNRRNRQYQVFAKALAAQFGEVVFEDTDLRWVARKGNPHETEQSRSLRHSVCPSKLSAYLDWAFTRAGGAAYKIKIDPASHPLATREERLLRSFQEGRGTAEKKRKEQTERRWARIKANKEGG